MNPEHDCCYIAYGGEEIAKEYYDVRLISPQKYFLIMVTPPDPCGSTQLRLDLG